MERNGKGFGSGVGECVKAAWIIENGSEKERENKIVCTYRYFVYNVLEEFTNRRNYDVSENRYP